METLNDIRIYIEKNITLLSNDYQEKSILLEEVTSLLFLAETEANNEEK